MWAERRLAARLAYFLSSHSAIMDLLEGREVEAATPLLEAELLEFVALFFGGDDAARLVGGADATEVSAETETLASLAV